MIKLPIDPYLAEISARVVSGKPVILTASPGSGKTTRVPAALVKQLMNQSTKKSAVHHSNNNQVPKIIVIVPKRVSALSAAHRVSDENSWTLGNQVGYQVRFENKSSPQTQLVFMTEGVFLKRLQTETFWDEIDTIIIDEFHERSTAIDVILGLAYEQKTLGREFNLMVMSATLNTQELKNYFGDCSTVEVVAPPHQLQIYYSEKSQKLTCDDFFFQNLKDTLQKAWKISKKDILIFLPGQKEMIKFKNLIFPIYPQTPIEILHGSLSLSEQSRIVQNTDKNVTSQTHRRIILSTNVAESSLTVSGVDCVIDSGLEKKAIYEPKVGFQGLDLQRISIFSAQQRAGRAAREQDGHCFKLWHPTDELSMKEQIEPAILKSPLLEESLLILQQRICTLANFSWLTKPAFVNIQKAEQQLQRWHLIDPQGTLTEKAEILNHWPISLENSILHYELSQNGFHSESARLIAFLESGQIENYLTSLKHEAGSDIDKILNALQIDPQIERIEKQILKICHPKKHNQFDSMNEAIPIEDLIIKVYAKYFPEKIAAVKNNLNAVSIYGRGLQISFGKIPAQCDFFIALAGFENNSQFTQVTCFLSFDKKKAILLFSNYAKRNSTVYFDQEKNEFYKLEQLKYESLILNDYGKTKLTESELRDHWKILFKNNPSDFLSHQNTYKLIKNKLIFLHLKNGQNMSLQDKSIDQIINFDHLLAEFIHDHVESYDEFKHCDLIYYSYQILTEELCDLLQNLPDFITSPKGRSHPINYTDDKAPMISLKIQDAFGWSDTPQICQNKFTLTLELLAPNMRPAQITNQLGLFWKTSYLDVRKDLRARYPKHDWPEKP